MSPIRTGVILFSTLCAVGAAQNTQQHTNDWQVAVSPRTVEPTDTKSRKILAARGEIFDKFAPIRSSADKSEPGTIIYSPGSVGRRPELPVGESDAIVVARFTKHMPHLSPSGKSVYTEIILTPSVVIKSGAQALEAGTSISILESGGAIRASDGKILRSPVALHEFSLIPNHSYLAFLRFNTDGKFYELIKSWDLTTGTAVPNSTEDTQLAKENKSKYAGLSKQALIDEVKAKLK